MCRSGSGSASNKNPDPHQIKTQNLDPHQDDADPQHCGYYWLQLTPPLPFQSYDSHIAMNPGYVRRHVAGTAKDAARTDSLWRLTRSFRVHVLLATYVNVKARMENIFY
jgi:hypothetical protein